MLSEKQIEVLLETIKSLAMSLDAIKTSGGGYLKQTTKDLAAYKIDLWINDPSKPRNL